MNIALPNDPLNQAVDDILTQCRNAKYKGHRLFESAERGLFVGDPETGLIGYRPEEDQVPCVRVWDVMQTGLDETVDLFASEWECAIAIYVYFFSFDGSDMQAFRNSLCRLLHRRLSTPNGDRPAEAFYPENIDKAFFTQFGIWPPVSGLWQFSPNQNPLIEHTNVFKDINYEVPMDRFWYASRIKLNVITSQSAAEDVEEEDE